MPKLTRFDRIPTRKGKRPSTICGPLHIQCSGSGDTKYFRGLITEVLTWPHVESTPPVTGPPHGTRTEKVLGFARQVLETPQKDSVAEPPKANEARRECLAGRAAEPELDGFLGQVMAAMTRQFGAVSSRLRVRNFEQNTLPLEFVFQDGRVMAPKDAKYPQDWRTVSLDEQLTFRFVEERDFHPEELEIARALATQANLAIQLTRLAQAARQAVVLEERNRLAGEIHDGLAQSFTAICMQLGVAKEALSSKEGDALCSIQRAIEVAKFGLAEARRCAHNLRSSNESGLAVALQGLVERTSLVGGRLRCNFRSDNIPENSLPPRVQHELLRIAQEAIHNSVRHANPTTISVSLHRDGNNLELQIRDNGYGIPPSQLLSQNGFGLINMQSRAKKVGASLDIRSDVGAGTVIVVRLPINT
jgi:signal transduction histidine kinase